MIIKDLVWDTAKRIYAARLAEVEGHLSQEQFQGESLYAISAATWLHLTWENADPLLAEIEGEYHRLQAEDAGERVEAVPNAIGTAFMDFVCTKCRKKFGILWSDGVTEVQCTHCGTLVDISDDLEQIAAIRERMMEKKRDV